jgi:hypothetical protein
MFIIGAVFFAAPTAALASEDSPGTPLIVKEVWLTGDTLHISVADGTEGQIIELNLREYAMPSDEYVTVKATDSGGRESNAITFKNPYYQQNAAPPTDDGGNVSAVPSGAVPFTPDGTGSVLDNVTEANGKEFFSITTEDGNVFYLIVDRERNTDNVYLLNAVTEDDLASLAKSGDGKSVSAVETPTQPPVTPTPPETPAAEPTPAPEPAPEKNDNTATLAFVGVAALVIGGIFYYVKFARSKKGGGSASDYEEEPEDDFDDDDVVDLDSDGEDGDDE